MDYEQDLLADILRFFPQYGTEPLKIMPGPLFCSLAPRLSAYGGVMAYRVQEIAVSTDTVQPSADNTQVVDFAAFRAMHPGLVEVARANG